MTDYNKAFNKAFQTLIFLLHNLEFAVEHFATLISIEICVFKATTAIFEFIADFFAS